MRAKGTVDSLDSDVPSFVSCISFDEHFSNKILFKNGETSVSVTYENFFTFRDHVELLRMK